TYLLNLKILKNWQGLCITIFVGVIQFVSKKLGTTISEIGSLGGMNRSLFFYLISVSVDFSLG
ncbi:MAG: hypothetical protein WBO76_05565, partial [Saprospiraceae bacterium]